MKKIIDLSQYNKVTSNNLNADGVILRLGYTGHGSNTPTLDKSFVENFLRYSGKYPVGVYYVTLATTPEDVKRETDFVIKYLKGSRLELPVWVDVESQLKSIKWTKASKKTRSAMVALWCETMEKAGYYVGVYANKDWFTNKLEKNPLLPYDKWVAQYASKCTYSKTPFGLWQFTSSESGKEHGVYGKVDASYMYKDYPTIIKKAKLNGWGVK